MNKKISNKEGQILIYETEKGQYAVDVLLNGDTVWLTQQQMAGLFDKSKSTINEHIQNIYDEKELILDETMKKFGISEFSTKPTNYYNLDVIISVGYRVNSLRGTRFRIWATHTLKEHLLKGYTLNQKRLAETGVKELENALRFIQSASKCRQLTNEETQGLLEIIARYAKSWLLLKSYDENQLPSILGQSAKFSLSYEYALKIIQKLKETLMSKGEASTLFGNEYKHSLEAILGNLEQSFDGQALYSTLEDKAAHLLYFIIKDHPFTDGNKRIASLLFIHYLDRNHHLHKTNGEVLINDNALVALALLIAESEPRNKELMIALIKNLLVEKN